MKPKVALKLVPISGLVFDLHTATLLALWGGKASHVQQYCENPTPVNQQTLSAKEPAKNLPRTTQRSQTRSVPTSPKRQVLRGKQETFTVQKASFSPTHKTKCLDCCSGNLLPMTCLSCLWEPKCKRKGLNLFKSNPLVANYLQIQKATSWLQTISQIQVLAKRNDQKGQNSHPLQVKISPKSGNSCCQTNSENEFVSWPQT